MKKLAFMSLAVLGFSGVNEIVWGMPNPSDNREDSRRTFERNFCYSGYFQRRFNLFQDEFLNYVEVWKSVFADIQQLEKENFSLKKEENCTNQESFQSSFDCDPSLWIESYKKDITSCIYDEKAIREVFDKHVQSLRNRIEILQKRLRELKEENISLSGGEPMIFKGDG